MMPKLGMHYSDVARRIKRIKANPGNPVAKEQLIDSLRRQCQLAEGDKALRQLDTEINSKRVFSCSGSKQVGACLKFDCKNMATDKCNSCYKFDEYRPARSAKSADKSSALSLNAG